MDISAGRASARTLVIRAREDLQMTREIRLLLEIQAQQT